MNKREHMIQTFQRWFARLTGETPRVRRHQKGSALLVSLMIMVGLTLLGLGFVAITQTESAISMNEKNYTQTLQRAEAAANRVVDWFQNPNWAFAEGIMPDNVDAIKVTRTITLPGAYTGKYKSNVGTLLFDRPYKPDAVNRFYGTETNPDVWINTTTAPVFLTTFNVLLFNNNASLATMDNNEGGVITDIRVFAPPVQGAAINSSAGWTAAASGAAADASGFVEGGTRFGIATIEATATKYSVPCPTFPCGGSVIATRTVKITVAEWPFPGPQGPVQTNADLDTSGNIRIHWGMTTATGDMDMAKTAVSLPWMDAYDVAHYEHGYDVKTWPQGYNSGAWPKVASTAESEVHDWLYELVGHQIEDPWWQMRARGSLGIGGFTPAANPIPYPFTYGNNPSNHKSNWFQGQYQNTYPDRKDTLFPRIDYNFWKQLAQAGDDQPNIYYLQNVLDGKGGTTEDFKDKAGNTRSFEEWVDTTATPPAGTGPKSVAGFYFFDTANGINPQNGGGGTLTAPVQLQGGTLQMKGFVYANLAQFGTKGLGGVAEWINMPGEPYRDIGYLKVDDSSGDFATSTWKKADPAGVACDPVGNNFSNCVLENQNNGQWDFQDLSISNTNAGKNGIFDFKVAQRSPSPSRSAGAGGGTVPAADNWFIVPYVTGCNPGVDCSEPHEPYLNLIYPTSPTGSPAVDWHNPALLTATIAGNAGTQTRRPKRTDAAGNPVTCVAESTAFGTTALKKADLDACTSNAYDKDGGLVSLANILDGVLYVEGDFDTTGNANYFGSVLVEGDATKAGNPEIYFDERLVKGQWPPASFGFPRVYVSGVETDQ